MSFEISGMHDMSNPQAKRAAYKLLLQQAQSLMQGERDWLANLAQFSALIYGAVPDLNWAGFYMARGEELVLGPFQGKVACVRIPFSRGVCGACARTRQILVVEDVHAVADHIACDSASQSELVLPVIVNGELRAVFDMDSPTLARFDEFDGQGMANALAVLIQATDWD